MEEDKFALVEKIIKDVHNVLSKIADLYAFDVVPMDINFQNKSPVLHLENCLGLESWCVKHVYMYCYSELMDKYSPKFKRKSKKISNIDSDRLIRLLNVTILLNPEINSLWNKRRDLVLGLLLDKTVELHFIRLVLSRKPKCNEAFVYRRWLLETIFQEENYERNSIEHLINDELIICDLASDKSPNNYHSWNHRIWLLNKVKTISTYYDPNALYIKEYNSSEKWTSKHVSDFSCFHYHQYCIKNLYNLCNDSWKSLEKTLNINFRKNLVRVLASNFPKDVTIQASEENLLGYSEENLMNLLLSYSNKICNCIVNYVPMCKKIEILFHALVLNNELICFYKYHETLWYHRRFILHEIISIMYEHFGLVRYNGALVKKNCKICNFDDMRQKQAKIGRYDTNHIYSSVLFNVILSHEKQIIEERQKDGDPNADRHEKYLKFVEGFNNVM
ncbi:protein prenyltransferase alpha subunit repeat-containing protein 1 isoform X1 [Vanessa tameamea]|uniref:Protein prenyltransferase alpha subunit repeat-containing protein 1 isoform X1 n=1 Tax=Vanessa tameamea TaxID=334116 RepID=A0A8B8IAH2_VANTA|nr:protein prenyltransferase alpha subunit repeat-containing protein 1 isoform X1 [Vanessa tameamea]